MACFKAGIIAVPVFPPDPRKLIRDLDHFVSIQESSGAKFALTHAAYNYAKKVSDLTNLFSTKRGKGWPNLKWVPIDDILAKGKSQKSSFNYSPNTTVAFLQYTSGKFGSFYKDIL